MFQNPYQALMFYFRFRLAYPIKSYWKTEKSDSTCFQHPPDELLLLALDIEKAINQAGLSKVEFEFLRLYFEGRHTYFQMARYLNQNYNANTTASELYNWRRRLIRKIHKELIKLGLIGSEEEQK